MKKTYLIIVAVLFNVAMINAQNKINKKINFKNYAWNLDNNNRNNSQADFVVPNNDPCFMDSVPSLFIYGGGYYAETQKAQLFYILNGFKHFWALCQGGPREAPERSQGGPRQTPRRPQGGPKQ